jgi:2-haloacid dehalogenase
MTVVRWVTFDCFGTLVDWHRGFAEILRPLAGERTPEVLAAYHRHEPVVEKEKPHRLYKEVLATALARAAKDVGVALSEAQARRLPERWSMLRVFDDAEPMLSGLRSRGCKLAVLTNCDVDLFAQTERGFKQPFDLVVTAERVGDYKPSLAHFTFFERTTGVTRSEWVHVACSWFHDIAPAYALGISRVWLDRDRTGEDPSTASAYVRSADQVCEAVFGLM